MKRYARRMAYAFLVTAFAAVAFFAAPSVAASTTPATESATVKVLLAVGHGSGVHIGDGFIVTAAHVVGDAKEVQLKAKGGALRKADVLWVNKANDIALLRTSSDGLGVAKLACHAVKVGDPIVAHGNPLKIEFVAAYGKIAGEPRETGPWKSVYVTDITTVMGQSGGPVYADNGDLIGITVGVMAAPIGFSGSLVGYGYVVPSTAVCELLARK